MRLALAALLVLVSGCVHTQPASLATADGRASLNARTAGRVATLHLRGERRAVRDLRIGPDETTWTDRLSGTPQAAPTSDVRAVSLRRGFRWRAVLIGAGVGTAVGLLAAVTDDGGGSWVTFTPAYYVGTSALTGVLVGAGVTAAQADRYRIEPGPALGVRLDSLGRR